MELLSLIWSDKNYLFTSAILIMLIIGILEGLLTIIGIGISSAVDNMFPDLDVSIDVPNTEIHSFTELFGWINKGRVPVLMLFICFLTFFGLIGLIIQYTTNSMFNQYIVAIPAFLLSMPLIRYSSVVLSKIMPHDESTAVSEKTFIGKIAIITNGTAKRGAPTEARLVDEFNETHYIMVEPFLDEDSFSKDDTVFVKSQDGYKFLVTEDPNKTITQ